MSRVYNEIYKIVQSIPKGRVLTYGLISNMIGGRMSAQGVGWALKALGGVKRMQPLKKSTATSQKATAISTKAIASKKQSTGEPVYNSATVPWQRVVNAQGGTSTHKVGLPPELQKQMLEAEGIVFDDENRLDLDAYLWKEGLNKEWKIP
ncbi:MGMT family protein [soil metagenome]